MKTCSDTSSIYDLKVPCYFLTTIKVPTLLICLQTLLEGGADINAIVWGNGDTVLIAAAEFCDLPLITGLVEGGVNVTAKNVFGRTALHTAALKPNNTDVLALMLENGIDINEKTDAGVTALNDASWMGNKANIEYLLGQVSHMHRFFCMIRQVCATPGVFSSKQDQIMDDGNPVHLVHDGTHSGARCSGECPVEGNALSSHLRARV